MIIERFNKNFRNPCLAAMIIFSIIMTLAELFTDDSLGILPCLIASLDICAIIILYFKVSLGSLILSVVSAATIVYPYELYPPLLWGMFLAFMLMGYNRCYFTLIVCFCIQVSSNVISFACAFNMEWTIAGAISLLSIFVLISIAGLAIRNHLQSDDHKISEKSAKDIHEQNLLSRRNRKIAGRLHDSTSRGLTLIMLNTELCSDNMMSTEAKSRIDAIKCVASDTLKNTRLVVDELLNGKDNESGNQYSVYDIKEMISLWMECLKEYDFHGCVNFEIDDLVPKDTIIPREAFGP